jgi:hypothetical protein
MRGINGMFPCVNGVPYCCCLTRIIALCVNVPFKPLLAPALVCAQQDLVNPLDGKRMSAVAS